MLALHYSLLERDSGRDVKGTDSASTFQEEGGMVNAQWRREPLGCLFSAFHSDTSAIVRPLFQLRGSVAHLASE